jgi:hypothetical protein
MAPWVFGSTRFVYRAQNTANFTASRSKARRWTFGRSGDDRHRGQAPRCRLGFLSDLVSRPLPDDVRQALRDATPKKLSLTLWPQRAARRRYRVCGSLGTLCERTARRPPCGSARIRSARERLVARDLVDLVQVLDLDVKDRVEGRPPRVLRRRALHVDALFCTASEMAARSHHCWDHLRLIGFSKASLKVTRAHDR